MCIWNGGFEKVKAAIFNRFLTFIYEKFDEKRADVEGKQAWLVYSAIRNCND